MSVTSDEKYARVVFEASMGNSQVVGTLAGRLGMDRGVVSQILAKIDSDPDGYDAVVEVMSEWLLAREIGASDEQECYDSFIDAVRTWRES
jgi:hypothetical protein